MKDRLAPQALLQIQVEVLRVGRTQVGVGPEKLAAGSCASDVVHRHVGIERPTRERHREWCGGTSSRVCGTRAEKAVPWKVAQKNILGERVIEHTPSAADHRLALTR